MGFLPSLLSQVRYKDSKGVIAKETHQLLSESCSLVVLKHVRSLARLPACCTLPGSWHPLGSRDGNLAADLQSPG